MPRKEVRKAAERLAIPAKAPRVRVSQSVSVLLMEALEIFDRFNRAKRELERADQIIAQLRRADLSGTGYEVVDNFRGKAVVFRPAAVRRFELRAIKEKKR